MGISLSLYNLAAPFLRPKPDVSAPPIALPTRPPGPIVWLHAPQSRDRPVVDDLIARLTDQLPDLWFLITTNQATEDEYPDNCFHQPVPHDIAKPISEFLGVWKPDIVGWIGGPLRPGLVAQTNALNVPFFLFDSGSTLEVSREWLRMPGLTGATLRKFTKILSGDGSTAMELRKAGAREGQIETIGVLEREKEVLPYEASQRDALAQLLTARSTWLAAKVDPVEFELVIDAHMMAIRRSHRSMLILAPADPADSAQITDMLLAKNIPFQQRSAGEDPNSETQIYVADVRDELGLWYRLAPVSYIGGTLIGSRQPSANPLDAAALGSAVIHGSTTTRHRDAFRRLGRAGAAEIVSNADELARVVENLLSPDTAAQMAHAGWNVSSAGAEVTDQVVELLARELTQQGIAE